MPPFKGSRALLELLVQEGVELLVGNPGSTELELMDALADDTRVRYVLALHEGVATAIADGYAQAGGRLVAVNLHAAPGLGNALGMLYNAKRAGSPLLMTAGQQDQAVALTEPLLWDDLGTIARPFVKWSYEVRSPAELPRAVHRAAKTALAPPTGPVFLSVPSDVLASEAEIDLQRPSRVEPALHADPEAIDRAACLLASAERPVIIAGDAVDQRSAHDQVVRLAELLGAPVFADDLGNTASFPASHPLFAGTLTRMAPAVRSTLEAFDVLLSVGGDLYTESLATGVSPIPENLRIVHVDTDPWQLAKSYPTDVALLGDPPAVASALAAALVPLITDDAPEASRRPGRHERRSRAEAFAARRRDEVLAHARAAAGRQPVAPLALLHALGGALPPEAVVVDETLSSGDGIRVALPRDGARTYFGMRGGGIGWGLPAAVGARLALPDRPVVALVGDGSALYSAPALWTAAHEGIPVTFVIVNNRSYRILKQRTRALGGTSARTGRFVAMDLVDPPVDFVTLAQSFGVPSSRADTVEQALDAVRDGLAAGGPTLVDVAVDGSL